MDSFCLKWYKSNSFKIIQSRNYQYLIKFFPNIDYTIFLKFLQSLLISKFVNYSVSTHGEIIITKWLGY